MLTIIRTDSDNADFRKLVVALDQDLAARNGEQQSFFAQFNKIDAIKHVVVAYEQDEPVGCGAFKPYADDAMEVKRMFVPLTHRGKGIASVVLGALEQWCKELGVQKCILETGEKQPEAIRLYHKNGYKRIPNFGQYADVAESLCFEKVL